MLPSLPPLPGNSKESPVATLIPSTATPAMPVVPAPLPTTCVQPPAVVATVLEGETPMDIDTETIYSPIYTKDTKSQLMMQAMSSRPNSHSQSPVQSARNYQLQTMPNLSLFEPVEQLEQQHASQINGKRLNHTSPVLRQHKRHKAFTTTTTTSILEAASSPYPHFSDISWSNSHPEPLAVPRWLRIASSRKQYNFNIHWHKTPPTPGWGPYVVGVCFLPPFFREILFIVAHVVVIIIVIVAVVGIIIVVLVVIVLVAVAIVASAARRGGKVLAFVAAASSTWVSSRIIFPRFATRPSSCNRNAPEGDARVDEELSDHERVSIAVMCRTSGRWNDRRWPMTIASVSGRVPEPRETLQSKRTIFDVYLAPVYSQNL